ncbi:rCG35680 [Rattus norvegicus]|uniref:RCG35680 n=1 Tax=Rattus norvegicus TaxID=10116 RepID=A6MGU9_RAT|nr:rCG35680 [Rattus norvegicus]
MVSTIQTNVTTQSKNWAVDSGAPRTKHSHLHESAAWVNTQAKT